MAKKHGSGKANTVRVIVSLIYIILGAGSVFTAIDALFHFELYGLLTSIVGVLMFVAGILGLFRVHPAVYRLFGVLIFAVSAFCFVWKIINGGGFDMTVLTQVLLSWLFILCV